MRTPIGLYISYPASWGIAIITFTVIVAFAFKKLKSLDNANKTQGNESEEKVSLN